MINRNRILACMVASTLAVGMASCGSAPENKEQTASETTGTSEVQEEPAQATKLSLFVDESWWSYDSWKGAIPEEFNKRANVEIEAIRAVDDKQLPLMVASGDMTDLVCSYRYQYMANDQVSYALDTLKEEYADVEFPIHSVTKFVNTMSNGHYYTVGVGFSPESEYAKYNKVESEGPGFFFRKDIAEELDLKFETLEDLDTAFAKIKSEKPDMITTSYGAIHKFGWLRQMMGLPRDTYYVSENGELDWYINATGQLDYYKKVNEWYRKGYFIPDNFAFQTEDETNKLAIAGQIFSVFSYDSHADWFNTSIAANGDSFSFQQETDILGKEAKKYNNGAGGRGMYITKSCKEVERAYETVAYMYGDEGMKLLMWGIEGEDYTLNDEGYPEFTYNFQGDNTVLEPRGLKYWGWLVHNAMVTGIADVTQNSMTAQARIEAATIEERNPVIGMIRFETDSQEAITNSKIEEMIKAEEINIYMADSEAACEEAYNTMIQKANEIGMQKLVEYGNKTYAELAPQYEAIKDSAE